MRLSTGTRPGHGGISGELVELEHANTVGSRAHVAPSRVDAVRRTPDSA